MSTADKYGTENKQETKGKRKGGKKPKMSKHARAVGMASCYFALLRNGAKDAIYTIPKMVMKSLENLEAIPQDTSATICPRCDGTLRIFNRRKQQSEVCHECNGSGHNPDYQWEDTYRIPLKHRTIGQIIGILQRVIRDGNAKMIGVNDKDSDCPKCGKKLLYYDNSILRCKGCFWDSGIPPIGYVLPSIDNYGEENYGVGTVQNPTGAGELPAHARSSAIRRAKYREMERAGIYRNWQWLGYVYGANVLDMSFEPDKLPLEETLNEISLSRLNEKLRPDWQTRAEYWFKLLDEYKDVKLYHIRKIERMVYETTKRLADERKSNSVYFPNGTMWAVQYWIERERRMIDISSNEERKKANEEELKELEKLRKEYKTKKDSLRSQERIILAEITLKPEEREKNNNRLISIRREIEEIDSKEIEYMPSYLLSPAKLAKYVNPSPKPSEFTEEQRDAEKREQTTLDVVQQCNAHILEYRSQEKQPSTATIPFREPLPPKFVTSLVGTKREIRDRHLELVAIRAEFPVKEDGVIVMRIGYPPCENGEGI